MLRVIYAEEYLKYSFGKDHPFWPERAAQFIELLRSENYSFELVSPSQAEDQDILLVHTRGYLDGVKRLYQQEGSLSIDTPLRSGILEAAYYSVGGSILACQMALAREKVVNTLGGLHHAETSHGGGFCIFNDHAIAIRKLQKENKITTAAILDLDVHAGNGTQEIFYEDPSVLTISIHQDPTNFYPGTGFAWQKGEGKGEGFNLNFPLPGGTGEKEYLATLDKALEEINDFKYDLLVVVLGVDTYKEDPLASLQLEKSTYGKIAQKLKNWSPKVILCAGGYSKEVPDLWYEFVQGL